MHRFNMQLNMESSYGTSTMVSGDFTNSFRSFNQEVECQVEMSYLVPHRFPMQLIQEVNIAAGEVIDSLIKELSEIEDGAFTKLPTHINSKFFRDEVRARLERGK